MTFTVYILQSKKDNSYYIGYSSDIESRIQEHNYESTGYTSKKRPWVIVYIEEFEFKKDAIARERHIKKQKNRKYIRNLINTWVRSSTVEQSR